MGDAGRDAIDHFLYEEDKYKIKGIYWLKVPHHGSKYNMDNWMIDHLRPKNAFISTEKVGHYLSQAVVNALKNVIVRFVPLINMVLYGIIAALHQGMIIHL